MICDDNDALHIGCQPTFTRQLSRETIICIHLKSTLLSIWRVIRFGDPPTMKVYVCLPTYVAIAFLIQNYLFDSKALELLLDYAVKELTEGTNAKRLWDNENFVNRLFKSDDEQGRPVRKSANSNAFSLDLHFLIHCRCLHYFYTPYTASLTHISRKIHIGKQWRTYTKQLINLSSLGMLLVSMMI